MEYHMLKGTDERRTVLADLHVLQELQVTRCGVYYAVSSWIPISNVMCARLDVCKKRTKPIELLYTCSSGAKAAIAVA